MGNRRQRYLLQLHDAIPNEPDAPVLIRLRRAMKCLLRSFGLRCSRAELLEDKPTPAGGLGDVEGKPIPREPNTP